MILFSTIPTFIVFFFIFEIFDPVVILLALYNLNILSWKGVFLAGLLFLSVFYSSGLTKILKMSMYTQYSYLWQKFFIISCLIISFDGIIAHFLKYYYDGKFWLPISVFLKRSFTECVILLSKVIRFFFKYERGFIYNNFIGFSLCFLWSEFCKFVNSFRFSSTKSFWFTTPNNKNFINHIIYNHPNYSDYTYTDKDREKIIYNIFKSLFWCVPCYFDKLTFGLLKDNLIIYLTNTLDFLFLVFYLRDSSRFLLKQNIDINCVDIYFSNTTTQTLSKPGGYELYYFMLSLNNRFRLILKSFVDRFASTTLSITRLYNSTNWSEREIWDMFGVYFIGNKDHRRILTDYGFVGFPLRKSFPPTGFVEVYYSEMLGKLRYIPVSFKQEFRIFFYNEN